MKIFKRLGNCSGHDYTMYKLKNTEYFLVRVFHPWFSGSVIHHWFSGSGLAATFTKSFDSQRRLTCFETDFVQYRVERFTVSFEKVFESVSDDIKKELIFYMRE